MQKWTSWNRDKRWPEVPAMDNAEFIGPGDERWASILEKTKHDFYHLPGYVTLQGEHESARPVAFYAECRRFSHARSAADPQSPSAVSCSGPLVRSGVALRLSFPAILLPIGSMFTRAVAEGAEGSLSGNRGSVWIFTSPSSVAGSQERTCTTGGTDYPWGRPLSSICRRAKSKSGAALARTTGMISFD